MSGPPGGGNSIFVRPPSQPVPPPLPPPSGGGGPRGGGGGFGRQLLAMAVFGAGMTVAIAGISALFGGRKQTVVHQAAPPAPGAAGAAPTAKAKNPALTRPITNCAQEEETLRQCMEAQGDCAIYQKRVDCQSTAQIRSEVCYSRGGSKSLSS